MRLHDGGWDEGSGGVEAVNGSKVVDWGPGRRGVRGGQDGVWCAGATRCRASLGGVRHRPGGGGAGRGRGGYGGGVGCCVPAAPVEDRCDDEEGNEDESRAYEGVAGTANDGLVGEVARGWIGDQVGGVGLGDGSEEAAREGHRPEVVGVGVRVKIFFSGPDWVRGSVRHLVRELIGEFIRNEVMIPLPDSVSDLIRGWTGWGGVSVHGDGITGEAAEARGRGGGRMKILTDGWRSCGGACAGRGGGLLLIAAGPIGKRSGRCGGSGGIGPETERARGEIFPGAVWICTDGSGAD